MAIIDEKKIRAYHRKEDSGWICPVCASDEERQSPEKVRYFEDAIHDEKPMYCIRCKKKIA